MNAEHVIEALVEQVVCYRRLAKLSEIQHEHVQQSRTDKLLEVLGSRQEILNDVARCEALLGPAKRGWAEYVSQLDAPHREQADALLAESRRLLEQITTADRNDALVLQQRKLDLGRQIKQAAAAREINRSYAASAYGTRNPSMDLSR